MVKFKDMNITGQLIANKDEDKRYFTILGKPVYQQFQKKDGTEDNKVIFNVELATGEMGNYIPNKPSLNRMVALTDTIEMDEWVGKTFIWGKVVKMMVAGDEKDVVYVTDMKKPDSEQQ